MTRKLYTKPCERSGCEGLAKALSLKELPKRRFCSSKCCYEVRRATGDGVPRLTREQRTEFGRRGGLKGAETRRRAAVIKFAAEMETRIPESLMGKLTHREQVLLTTLLTRTWERGWLRGVACQRLRQGVEEQAQKITEAA